MAKTKHPGIEVLPSGSYRWRIKIDGIPHRGTEHTLAGALRARLEVQLQSRNVAQGEIDPTVDELIAVWLTDVEHRTNTSVGRDYALSLVPQSFRDRPAVDITAPAVAALWRQMSKITGPHVVIKASNAMSKAFALGVELGIVPRNVFADITPKQPPKSAKITPPAVADVKRLIAHMEPRPELQAWVRTMAVCGARPGELSATRWDGLNERDRTLWVGPSVERNGAIGDGKNGPGGHRTVHLDQATFDALWAIKKRGDCPWVFTFDGETPWSPERAPREIRRACDADKLNIKMRPYDLRHFAATQALGRGETVPDVAYMLGDNPATVMRVYAHHIPRAGGSATAVAAALDAN